MASAAALKKAREQAALEVFVRTNPEASALRQAILGTRSRFISTARAAQGSAAGIRALALAGRPVVSAGYQQALSTRDAEQAALDQHLSALGPAATDYKASSAREAAGARSRISEASARALADLNARAQNAQSGAAYATSAARSQYQADRGKLETRQRELARETGALTQLGIDKALEQSAAQRKSDRAYQLQVDALANTTRSTEANITGVDPKTGRPTLAARKTAAQAAKDAKNSRNKGHLTPDKKQSAVDSVGRARGIVQWARQQNAGISRAELAQRLTAGIPFEAEDPATKKRRKVGPAVTPVGQLWASVALDLEFDGHVSRRNRGLLRRKGVSAANAGWNTTPHPKPRRPGLGQYVGVQIG